MPLYRVVFADQGGARIQTHLRAPVAADHITLAVQKLWGPQCYWAWVPGSDTEGRVYERRGAAPGPDDRPRTSVATVQLTPARRRPRAG
jgi:hypothetical protein